MVNNILSAEIITQGLETRFIGQNVLYYPSLTTTMDVARQAAQEGAAEGTIVLADRQTAGRGRMERTWLSPEGNIALSVILYPPVSCLSYLIMVASLAVAHAIRITTDLTSQIKWPNDVLINNKKVSGILVETDVRRDTVKHAIIGIGINVNLRPAEFAEILPGATSIYGELGAEVSRLALVRRLLVEMENLYLALSSGGSVFEEWRDSLVTLGKQVQVRWGDTVYEGIAESVARDGSLLLRGSDGSLTTVVAGDATLTG